MANAVTKSMRSRPAKSQAPAAASPAPESAAQSKPNGLLKSSVAPMAAETRRAMIAEAAYYLAERQGFADGHDVENWLSAEKQIDAALSV